MYGLSHGAYWGLSLEAPAPSSLAPDVLRDLERAGVVPPGTAAQVGGVVVTKRLKQTRRPELVTAPGPLALGNPQNGAYRDLYGAFWALALYRGGPQLFQARAGVWVDRTDSDALGELVKGGVRHVSLAFDQAARPVLAWERDGLVYVRQWSAQAGRYVTRGPWPGHDPLLYADGSVSQVIVDSDVHVFHLDAERGVVLRRTQREVYAAGHELHAVPAGSVLDQLVSLPYRMQLIGEAGGKAWALVTDLYGVPTATTLGGLVAWGGGELHSLIVPRTEAATLPGAVEWAGGEVYSQQQARTEAATLPGAVEWAGGEVYSQQQARTEAATLPGTVEWAGGELLTQIVTRTEASALTGNVGWAGGTYE